jgi:antitoxin (DNA-binding transcriptional repressor) of toxin-antitoxin stability system
MVKVSLLEFRRDARGIVRRLRKGQRMILTYRGLPVARMEPITEETVAEDDPIYSLSDLAVRDLASISNEEIDRVIYEE